MLHYQGIPIPLLDSPNIRLSSVVFDSQTAKLVNLSYSLTILTIVHGIFAINYQGCSARLALIAVKINVFFIQPAEFFPSADQTTFNDLSATFVALIQVAAIIG